MASLRDSVKDYQEELRDGIAWVAFWKEGRSWNAELFHLEVDGIRIEWRAFTSIVQISVKDNGSGIHPDDLYHIFKRFYRSRFSKDTQGIGLGLSLTKAIVEAHNGTIEVDSTVGMGTSFTINFLNPTKL